MRAKTVGKMKRKPMCEGKRKVGIAVNSKETVLAIPNAVPSSGAVKRAVRIVDGAMRARTGRMAALRVNGLVLCGATIRRVEI